MAFEFSLELLYEGLIIVLILLVTYVVGKAISRLFKGAFRKAGIPETETVIVTSVVEYSIYLVGTLIALARLGIDVLYFWITLAVVAIVLGIASRSSIADIVSGYFLRVFGPFNIGDVVEIEGEIGLLKDLTLLRTSIETSDHTVYSIANSKVVRSKISNFTRHETDFPVKLEFTLSREARVEDVKLEILDIIAAYPKTKVQRPVQVYVDNITKDGTQLSILFYVPDFQLVRAARDFVAERILDKSLSGKIPLSYSRQSMLKTTFVQQPRKSETHNSRRGDISENVSS